MTPQQSNSKREAGWRWMPLIVGLIIGSTVAATTDQWWWATVGALAGAGVGAVAERFRRGDDR